MTGRATAKVRSKKTHPLLSCGFRCAPAGRDGRPSPGMDSMGPGWIASGIASGRCAIGDAWSTRLPGLTLLITPCPLIFTPPGEPTNQLARLATPQPAGFRRKPTFYSPLCSALFYSTNNTRGGEGSGTNDKDRQRTSQEVKFGELVLTLSLPPGTDTFPSLPSRASTG